LRNSNHNTHWACFLVFDNHVDILGVVGSERLHRLNVPLDQARALWSELVLRGWHHATDDEVIEAQMTYQKLLDLA
jgi:hypothetical protein